MPDAHRFAPAAPDEELIYGASRPAYPSHEFDDGAA